MIYAAASDSNNFKFDVIERYPVAVDFIVHTFDYIFIIEFCEEK